MYNRALDKIAAAVLAYRAGNPDKATALFVSACSDISVSAAMNAIERTNAKAFKAKANTRLRAMDDAEDQEEEQEEEDEEEAAVARRIRSRRLRRAAMSDDSAGIPMDQVGDDFRIEPEVEEADMDMMDEDGGELDMEADSEDYTVDVKDVPVLDTNARMKRAMANMRVAAAAKKKPAKKKPVMKRK